MANIYDSLRESHEKQRSLCRKLLRSHPDERREMLFKELTVELAAHAAAEERFLYSQIILDDMGLDSSRHAISEHHEMDEMVEDLQKQSPSSRGWLLSARALSKKVHHHLKEEETKFFQISGKILSDTQKKTLAGKYNRDYERMLKKLSGE